MNRHQRVWAALILGILSGYGMLALLLDEALTRQDRTLIAGMLLSGSALWFSLAATRRSRCNRQSDRR